MENLMCKESIIVEEEDKYNDDYYTVESDNLDDNSSYYIRHSKCGRLTYVGSSKLLSGYKCPYCRKNKMAKLFENIKLIGGRLNG